MDLDDVIDGKMKIEDGLIIPVRLGFGLVIGIFLLVVIYTIWCTYRDVMNAEDDATPHVTRNQSDVNRSRIRNGYPEIKKIDDLEMNLCVTKV